MKKFNFDIKSFLLILFNFLFLIVITLAFFVSLTNPFFKVFSRKLAILTFLFLLLFLFILLLIFKNTNKKTLFAILVSNLLLVLILLFFFGYYFSVTPSWDFGHIFRNAEKISLESNNFFSNYYYSKRYPNNLFITVLFTYIFKIFRYFNFNLLFSSINLNIVMVFFSILTTCLIIYKLFGLKVCALSSFLFCFITPFYTYAPIFYTDTLSMMFAPLSILCFLYYLNKNNIILNFLIGFILAFATGIKTNISIVFVGFLIFIPFIINGYKKIFKFYFILVVSFFCTTICITSLNQKFLDIPIKDAGLPSTHWIMMGLSNDGGYNHKDVLASLKYGPNKNNIKEFNIKEIKKRLNDFGFLNYSKFLYKKFKYTWSDGTYYAPVKLSRHPIEKTNLDNYIYGNHKEYFYAFSQGSHILLFFLILLGALGLFKTTDKTIFLCNICIFGVALFLLMWEARSRYLVCILPVLVISASSGLYYINNILFNRNLSN